MLQFISSLAIILVCGIALFLLVKKIREKALEHLPLKFEAVRSLQLDLEQQHFLVLPSASSQQLSPISMSMSDIAKLIEEKNELSRSRYDDDPVFFSSPEPIINYQRFLGAAYLPKPILEEIKNFCGEHNPVKEQSHSNYFLIFEGIQKFDRHKTEHIELYSSKAEAFDTWLELKESANNLCFIVQQWLEEHREHLTVKGPLKSSVA
jgi:hypothetical protein